MSQTERKTTFDTLPENFDILCGKVEHLIGLVTEHIDADRKAEEAARQAAEVPEVWFEIDDLCKYLPDKPTKATVYSWVGHRCIPYHKKTKKLTFLKKEIDEWLAKGRHRTADELGEEAALKYAYRKGRTL